jgi:hypothetical protein
VSYSAACEGFFDVNLLLLLGNLFWQVDAQHALINFASTLAASDYVSCLTQTHEPQAKSRLEYHLGEMFHACRVLPLQLTYFDLNQSAMPPVALIELGL